jgi:hypothetical protein
MPERLTVILPVNAIYFISKIYEHTLTTESEASGLNPTATAENVSSLSFHSTD